MKKNTTLVITRIIAVSVLLYAVVDIIFFVKWLRGDEAGSFNLGFPLTIAIGAGLLFLQEWARRLEIYLGLVAVAIGLISYFVPKQILSSISIYCVQISLEFSEWQLILIAVILSAEVVFLLLPSTARLFKPNEQSEEDVAPAEIEEQ
jgi:hypothetical protein